MPGITATKTNTTPSIPRLCRRVLEDPAALSDSAVDPYFLCQIPIFPCHKGSWFYLVFKKVDQIGNGSGEFPYDTEAEARELDAWSERLCDWELYDSDVATNIISRDNDYSRSIRKPSSALPPTTSAAPSKLPARTAPDPAAPIIPHAPTQTSLTPTKTSPAPTKASPAPTETSPAPTKTSPAPTKTSPAPTTSPCTLPTNQDAKEDVSPTKLEELVLGR